jgi:hypothetical protein
MLGENIVGTKLTMTPTSKPITAGDVAFNIVDVQFVPAE